MKRKLNILIACEESQAVCRAFRELGHNAYSCDLFKCSGTKFGTDEAEPHSEWHFDHDVTTVLDKTDLTLQNGEQAVIEGDWDIMIGHPPCTFLAVSGAKWMYHPDDKDKPIEERRPHPHFPNRRKEQEDGAKFFLFLANANVKRIAIENPVGVISLFDDLNAIHKKIMGATTDSDNAVYFDEEKFNVSMIDGTNAGLRLGLIINGNTYIFNLDEGNGEEKDTIEAEADSVVESIDGEGNPNYINDIALDINDYKANGELAGNNSLITIAEDEVIPIEFFVYLEGCDKNCFNVVQNKDVEITLGFQGVSVNEAQ